MCDNCQMEDQVENHQMERFMHFIAFVISVYAGYLGYNASPTASDNRRILNSIIGFLFGGLYILFYVLYTTFV